MLGQIYLAASLILAGVVAPSSPIEHHADKAKHAEKPEQELSYSEALVAEKQLLSSPLMKDDNLSQLLNDDRFLKVIDKADHEGKATDLTPEISKRLEKYRKEQAASTALQNAPWQHGPNTIKLAGPATIDLPKGYMYLPPAEAEKVRKALGQEPRNHPTALLFPELDTNRPWAGDLDFVDSGHFSMEQLAIDSQGFLEAIDDNKDPLANLTSAQHDPLSSLSNSAEWSQEPVLDHKKWLFSASHTKPGKSMDEQGTVIVFGRRWTAMLNIRGADLSDTNMKQMDKVMEGLRFEPGEAYADATPEDKTSTQTLKDLVVGPIDPGKLAFQAGIERATKRPSLWDALMNSHMLGPLGLAVAGLIRLISSRSNRPPAPMSSAPAEFDAKAEEEPAQRENEADFKA